TMLLQSRALLVSVVHDTFTVTEEEGQRVSFYDLFQVKQAEPLAREEDAILDLKELLSVTIVKPAGVVEFSGTTRWPSVSHAIVSSLLQNLDAFNKQVRKSQASAERQFVETRLAEASTDMRATEDRLESFLATNRQYSGSPELAAQRDRLQREVQIQ